MSSINTIWLNDHQYRYAFYENIDPNAPIGIFLMGNLQDIESVQYFSEYFSRAVNLFVIETPGTGLTNPLPATFTIQDQAKLLIHFLDHMNISSAHILAFSYATPVALELCLLWDKSLSLSMCGGMPGIPQNARSNTMAILADAIRDRKRFAHEFIKGLTVSDHSIPRGKVIARSAKQKIFQYTEKQINCFCENTIRILAYKPSKKLSLITIPSFLFIGEMDPYVTISNAKNLSSSLPNCKMETVKNADHLVHLEHPETTAKLMIGLTEKMIFLEKYGSQKNHLLAS